MDGMPTSVINDDLELVTMNANQIEQTLYTFRGSLIGRSILVLGLTWQILGLLIVSASLWGVSIRGRGATHGLFWFTIVCRNCRFTV